MSTHQTFTRPGGIVPAISVFQFLRIKPGKRVWQKHDLDDIKGTDKEWRFIENMYRWSDDRRKKGYMNDWDDFKDRIERWPRKYWVYSDKTGYTEKQFDNLDWVTLAEMISAGQVYIEGGHVQLQDDVLEELLKKKGVKQLVETMDLHLRS